MVYHEARLLDERRFDEQYELYADDALYWVPLTRGQPAGRIHTALRYEHKLLHKIRVARFKNPHAFAQPPRSHGQPVLQAPLVESLEEMTRLTVLRTLIFYTESQLDESVLRSGVAWHHVVPTASGLLIRLKKVELLNGEAALPSIQLFP